MPTREIEVPILDVDKDGNPVVGRTMRMRVHNCEYGEYPWDHWQRRALARGVSEKLAHLGRDLMREADQHTWTDELQKECGWSDDGEEMIRLALESPATALERWGYLMETDGLRGRFTETGGWEPLEQ